MVTDLEQLIRSVMKMRCETQTVEVKAAADGAPRVYDSLSSFSNQNEGGVILFGIDERRGFSLCGVYDVQDLMKKIHGQCEAMTPQVRPVFDTMVIDGKSVVALYVNGRPMSERPTYRTTKGIGEGSYVRIGDADVRMTATELYEIESFRDGRRDDVATIPGVSRSVLDDRKVSRFINVASEERPLLARRSDEEILVLTGAVKDDVPTLAGMLTLADYPQQSYPNLCITAVAVNDVTLRSHEDGTRFVDNKRYEGDISEMLEGALGFVARNSKTRTVVRDGHREDVPEYPETAVREIILNALMHRDYGPYSNGTPIRLVLFADRLECWNPGGLYGGLTVNELGYANMPTRNPTLVSMLEICKIAENRHSGIPVIRDEAQRFGLMPPEFVNQRGSFLVRFFNERRDGSEREGSPSLMQSQTASGESDMPAHQGAKPLRDVVRLREEIVRYCGESRSASEIAQYFGYDVQYLRREYIRPMVLSGDLTLTMPDKPRSKYQRYVSSIASSTMKTR